MSRPDLNELSDRVAEVNKANGWVIDVGNRRDVALHLALVVSEIVEAVEEPFPMFEAYYQDRADQAAKDAGSDEPVDALEERRLAWAKTFQVELVDTAMRAMYVLHEAGVDVANAVRDGERRLLCIDLQLLEADVMSGVVQPVYRAIKALRVEKPLEELLLPLYGELAR